MEQNLSKFNLTEEVKKNLNSWELFVAETYNRVYSEVMGESCKDGL